MFVEQEYRVPMRTSKPINSETSHDACEYHDIFVSSLLQYHD